MDELEKLKKDSLVQMAAAQSERDAALAQLRHERLEVAALWDAQANASSTSDPGILAIHERVRELHTVGIEQSNGRNEYKKMYETLVRECHNRLELKDLVNKPLGITPHHATLAN